MALSDTAIRNAKSTSKAFKLYDEKGLFIQVTQAGQQSIQRLRIFLSRFYFWYGGNAGSCTTLLPALLTNHS